MDAKSAKKPVVTRDNYLAKCKQIALDHIHDKGLMVFYIRKKKPTISIKVPYELADEIKKVLNIFPDMTEKSYANYLNAKSDDPAVEYALDSDEMKAFRTVRSVVQSKKSPIIGLIVAFKDGDDIKIGWSLCNGASHAAGQRFRDVDAMFRSLMKPVDQFNRYDGLRRAIERAQTIVELVEKSGDIPHTCMPYINQMMVRAKKRFAPREAKQATETQ